MNVYFFIFIILVTNLIILLVIWINLRKIPKLTIAFKNSDSKLKIIIQTSLLHQYIKNIIKTEKRVVILHTLTTFGSKI